MGLVFSVLVACVGVCELIAFYYNVQRNLTSLPVRGDLATLSDGYVKELRGLRKDLVTDLQKLQNNVDNIPTFGLNSHEDVEIEYNRDLVRSRSPSPRRFLVTEKEADEGRESSSSPRRFVVSEEAPALRSSQSQTSIPEFSIKEERNPVKSPDKPRYVLQEKVVGAESPVIPLPRQFIVTEDELDTLVFEDTDFELPPSLEPGPALDLPQVAELDQRKSRSPTPCGKIDVILEAKSFNTTEYWTNKVLVVPSRRSKSKSASPGPKAAGKSFLDQPKPERVRSKSESSGGYRDVTVDGVKKAASNSGFVNDEFEWSFPLEEPSFESYSEYLERINKSKNVEVNGGVENNVRRENNNLENTISKVQDIFNNEKTTAILAHAAEELKKVSSEEKSKPNRTSKAAGEPFWLIFSGEYTKAMNKDWHGQHFCCWQCDESLTGQRYVLRDDHPYCVSCYESVFANPCEKCSRTIGIDSKDLSYKDKHWHEACFLCTTCGESLVDKQFGSKGERIYCGSCYDQQFASRCDGCHEIFRAGTKKMEYKTRQWHEKCFCCCVCKVPIGTQSFIPREQEIYCAKCYEEKFATRCIKCNKVITSGGVTYKNEPWHRECFTCTHCDKSLAGERFTSRDEKPYCAECFGELFAKRCTACTKPITGIGGTKFISFEDRHWHNDCFFCAQCRTSLVGRGFITDQDDIICPECAKQRLM